MRLAMKYLLGGFLFLGGTLLAEENANPAEGKQAEPPTAKETVPTPAAPKTPVVQAKSPEPEPKQPPVTDGNKTTTSSPSPAIVQAPEKPPPPPPPDFHKEVRGILEVACIKCHGPEKQKGELRLDTLAVAKKGGDTDPAIIPGDISKSLLIERIILPADDEDVMPPKESPLPPEQINILKRWVQAGAKWPQGVTLESLTEKQLAMRASARKKTVVELSVQPPMINLETK